MTNRHNHYTTKIILPFLITYSLILILQYIVTGSNTNLFFGRCFSAALLITLSSHFFKSKFSYYKSIAILLILLGSVLYIKFITDGNPNQNIFNSFFGYITGISNLLLFTVIPLNESRFLKHIRPFLFFVVLLPVAAIWGYYTTANAFINVDTVLAVLQTNFLEAKEYLLTFANLQSILCSIIFLVLLAYLPSIITVNLTFRNISSKYSKALLCLIIICNIILVYKCRVNIVSGAFWEAGKYLKVYDDFNKYKEIRKSNLVTNSDVNQGLYVLVIGESHSKNYTSAYGYNVNTTPWLKKMKDSNNKNTILLNNAFSNHVQTTPSVTYAMTAKNQYNNQDLKNSVSLLEAVEAAGFETAWLSNQLKFAVYDTPITVIAEEANQQIWLNANRLRREAQAYDGELLSKLSTLQIRNNMLVIIHLMGSHGGYTSRYPKDFTPFGTYNNLATYSNSLKYNDFVMENIYNHFSNIPNFKALIYFSDHGEIPGIGHDTSHFHMDMTKIPMYILVSDNYLVDNHTIVDNIIAKRESPFTNDLIFNTVLGIMNIRIPGIYEAENDITKPSYNEDHTRFTTLHGKQKIFH